MGKTETNILLTEIDEKFAQEASKLPGQNLEKIIGCLTHNVNDRIQVISQIREMISIHLEKKTRKTQLVAGSPITIAKDLKIALSNMERQERSRLLKQGEGNGSAGDRDKCPYPENTSYAKVRHALQRKFSQYPIE